MSGSENDVQKREWLKRTLGFEFGTGTGGSLPDDAPQGDDGLRKALTATLRDTIARSAGLPQTAKTDLAKLGGEARKLIDGEDLLAAEIAVETMQDFLDDALQQARLDEAAGSVAKGLVRYRTLWLDWRNAQAAARADLESLANNVINDPDMQVSPLYDDVIAVAGNLGTLLPPFEPAFETLLQDLSEAGDMEQAEKLRAEALSLLGNCDALLQKAGQLERMQQFADAEYGSFDSFRRLRSALDGLRKELGG